MCHLISLVATVFHPAFATLRSPVLTPLLQPLSHMSPQEKHRGTVILLSSLYIEDVEERNGFSSLLFPLCFIPLRSLGYLYSGYHIITHCGDTSYLTILMLYYTRNHLPKLTGEHRALHDKVD